MPSTLSRLTNLWMLSDFYWSFNYEHNIGGCLNVMVSSLLQSWKWLGCMLDYWEIKVWYLAAVFFKSILSGSGAYSAFYFMVFWGPSLRSKGPGQETDHSPASSVKVKNIWCSSSNLFSAFMLSFSVMHRNDFTLPFYKLNCSNN